MLLYWRVFSHIFPKWLLAQNPWCFFFWQISAPSKARLLDSGNAMIVWRRWCNGLAQWPWHFWCQTQEFPEIPPGRLTWNIIMEAWKIIFLSKWVICRFYVNLPGCKIFKNPMFTLRIRNTYILIYFENSC